MKTFNIIENKPHRNQKNYLPCSINYLLKVYFMWVIKLDVILTGSAT
uniref:Uncharacterized protein n=1 Tax=Anguilla anguilla TaxID=7936 RepID=A0A0E9R2L6_ANGAN